MRRPPRRSIETTAALVLRHFADALPTADVVVLSDYAKGVLSDAVSAGRAGAGAGRPDRMVIADPKRGEFSAYRGASVLTPNELEVRQATRIEAADDRSADRAGRQALDDTGCEAVVVTRSAKGLTLVRRDGPALHLPTRAREVADVSGAGDTLVAALAVALGAGLALPEAAMLANVTAGISVGKPGTATVSREELLGVLHLADLVATDRKIATRDEAVQRAAGVARSGTAGRLRQWLLRPDPPRPRAAADRGAGTLRPAGRRVEHRCLGAAAEGADAAAAERDRRGRP